jgi:hypothetical protein
MDRFKLPPDYNWVYKNSRWTPPFGYHFAGEKRIEIYPCKFIPTWFGLRGLTNSITWNHETAHAWGIKGCKKPWCLAFELNTWNSKWTKNGWVEKLLALTGLFNKFSLCKKHKKELDKLER